METMVEDPGTQYFVVTARKGPGPDRRHIICPESLWTAAGNPVSPHSTIRILSPGGEHAALCGNVYLLAGGCGSRASRATAVGINVDGTALDARVARGLGIISWNGQTTTARQRL